MVRGGCAVTGCLSGLFYCVVAGLNVAAKASLARSEQHVIRRHPNELYIGDALLRTHGFAKWHIGVHGPHELTGAKCRNSTKQHLFPAGVGGPNAVAAAARLQGSADLFDKAWDSGLPGNLACGRRPAFGLNSVSAPSGVPTSKIVDDSLWHHPPYQDSACALNFIAMLLA